jgi:uncharacterized protein
MGTLLKFLLLALAVLWLWHSPALRGLRTGQTTKPPAPPDNKPKAKPSPDTIVSCSHCGLHVPEAEAFRNARQQPFCSAPHRDLHP